MRKGESRAFEALARARKSHVPVGLSPFDSIKFPENPVNIRFVVSEEQKQGGAFNAPFDLCPRCLKVTLFLAGSDDRLSCFHWAGIPLGGTVRFRRLSHYRPSYKGGDSVTVRLGEGVVTVV